MASSRLLPWFTSTEQCTPYRAFESWRLPARIAFYGAIVVLVGAIVWLGVFKTEVLDDCKEAASVVLAVAVGTVPILAPIFLWTLVRILWSPKRRLRRFAGRCLNCGTTTQSEFLDDCSTCDSSFIEQRRYRRHVFAPLPRRFGNDIPAYRGLRQKAPHLAKYRSRYVYATAAWIVMLSSIGVLLLVDWILAGIPSLDSPPRPILGEAAMPWFALLGFLFIMVAHVLGMSYELALVSHNVCRLDGRCFHCEGDVRRDDDLCKGCGTSLILQRGFVEGWLINTRRKLTWMPQRLQAPENQPVQTDV